MGILRRRAPKQEARKPEAEAASLVYERIEVTVEREWVATVVRGRPETGGEGAILEGNRLEDTTARSEQEDRKRS